MRNRLLTIGAAFFAAITAHAQPNPCPDCPPCTNCPPYTNPPPIEYDPSALLVRQVQIKTGSDVIYTGPNWILDTNNLLIASGGGWTSNAPSSTNWMFTLGVTNTSPTAAYKLQYSTNVAGPYADVTSVFIGTTNHAEYLAGVTLTNFTAILSGYWRVTQQPGFVAWMHAYTNGFPGGAGNDCSGTYNGYVNWFFSPPQWGFAPDTNVLHHTTTDLWEPTNRLEFATDYGFIVCGTGTVDWTNSSPLQGTAARFSVFYKTFPTNQWYPLYIVGYLYPGTNDISPH